MPNLTGGQWGIAVFILLVLIIAIATASIAQECYNKNADFAKGRKANNNFIKVGFIPPIAGIVGGFVYVVYNLMKKE